MTDLWQRSRLMREAGIERLSSSAKPQLFLSLCFIRLFVQKILIIQTTVEIAKPVQVNYILLSHSTSTPRGTLYLLILGKFSVAHLISELSQLSMKNELLPLLNR